MRIKYFDFLSHHKKIKKLINSTINRVFEDGVLMGGMFVEEFENSFSKMIGVKHCIAVGNGTDALFISLKMMGIGIGDEVITVANGWISASESISLTGAKPIFVDIDTLYDSICVASLERAINNKTKAIILTHFHGQMCDMTAIKNIAKSKNVPIIEDCAQAHLASFEGRYAGTWGLTGCFSFYPTKNLGAYGDAGCIVTNDDDLAKKLRMFARHGIFQKYEHDIEGVNSRMDSLQAAILVSKLPFLEKWTSQRRRNANLYHQYLKNIPEIQLPCERKNSIHVYHLFVIKCKSRDDLKDYLEQAGIETLIHYPIALPFLKAYEKYQFNESTYPSTFANQSKILSLPIRPELNRKEILYVCSKIKDFYRMKI
jgi:dTDP-4-amino-4,6-dideoxygalactose transaminase